MKLSCVYIRFYKSFNFDQLRKAHPRAEHSEWDYFDGRVFPYVRVPLDPDITTIVGANESGKTHLLSAIKKAITGVGIHQTDLCRYSPFFSVEQGEKCWPHIGLSWSNVTQDDALKLTEEIGVDAGTPFSHFLMFRESPDALVVYLPRPDGGFSQHELKADRARSFGKSILPQPFSIDPEIALPNAISIDWLAQQEQADGAWSNRRIRKRAFSDISKMQGYYATDQNAFAKNAAQLHGLFSNMFGPTGYVTNAEAEKDEAERQLARSLLINVAGVDPEKLVLLSDAIADGNDGYANAIVAKINDQLAKRLNFPKWWVQDRDFSLRLTPRDLDLVFTIQDKTGTEYTFSERSSGLKYFLSYLIQSRSRDRNKGKREILTMDEPDTYLSAEAQQDLLKIFESFAFPEGDNEGPIQVAFVTHSPFLIDKNHAHRIRVLEKGKGLDGTRVISNAAQNHYEPLRSAFGAFVGETAFVGACNLLVEGPADQIILAGAARLTRALPDRADRETLDLNRLVIVPCGSASQIPYMAYLIRGRDKDKPPVIALLDKDQAGDDALAEMKNSKKMQRLLDLDLVFQLDAPGLLEAPMSPSIEIEDFLPPALAIAAANHLLSEISAFRDGAAPVLDEPSVTARLADCKSGMFAALNDAAAAHNRKLEKIGFARAVIFVCSNPDGQCDAVRSDIDLFLKRMKRLFVIINERRRIAEAEARREQVGTKVHRHVSNYLKDYPASSTREAVLELIEGMQSVLDDSAEADEVRDALRRLKREHQLGDELAKPVADYEKLKSELGMLHKAFDLTRLTDVEGKAEPGTD